MSLKGHTLCFSGTLSTCTRAQASAAAKKHGAKVSSSVTSSTTALVAGPGAGAKAKQAEAKGIEIWTEEHFNSLIGGGSGSKAAAKPAAAKKAKATPKKKAPPAEDMKTPSPPKKKLKMEPATPAIPGTGGARRVMSAVQEPSLYSVFEDYDVKLMLSDSFNANSNKFYKLQLLQLVEDEDSYYVATNWGRLGEPGQSQLKGPHDLDNGIKAFCKVFRSKTKNDWGAPFVRHADKYQIVETLVEEEGGDAEAALGRLTEAQINKGQAVLKEIRTLLEEDENAASAGKRKRRKPKDREATLGQLSNDFYSLIPTTSGRQRPPRLDNLEIVTEKEGLLEFWLRMGFEEVSTGDMEGSPIDGVFSLAVPTTLKTAALSISDKWSIDSSQERGSELASEQAGDPVKKMTKEHYAAILLYTGNSIYRELNRCLRTEWKSVPKYWKYLRLYFEAANRMPTEEKTLWRGIAADLYDEYKEGKTITWWTISSCTSDKDVAENFMNQLGGSDATLLTLHTKTACDISSLSFYPHEQESLLRPGTKLRVIKRSKKGKVAHIEVEEVVDDEEEKEEEEKKSEEEEDKKPAAK